MTKEQKFEMHRMRLSGCTYKEIAEKFGCSSQRIHQIIPDTDRNTAWVHQLADICVYKGLSEYIKKNNMTLSAFTEILRPNYKGYNTSRIKGWISGVRDFGISDIRKILELTGMTFEECFALKEREDNKNE